MDHCARCGHALGIGRFCINCGHPVGQPVPLEEQPSFTTSAEPLAGDEAPPSARYPLFADEVEPGRTEELSPAAGSPGAGRGHSPLPYIAAAVALILVAIIGAILLGEDDGPESAPTIVPSTGARTASETVSETASESAEPSEPLPSPSIEPGDAGDVAELATPTVPDTAEPSLDVAGSEVRYDAFNMLDGDASTAWRMSGDATGEEIVLQLREPTLLTELGLINGYAKREPGYDGYTSNRRIRAVEWILDDGTVLSHKLGKKRRRLQTIPVDNVLTDTVRLRLVRITRPGTGSSGRDYTAISDISIVGSPV